MRSSRFTRWVLCSLLLAVSAQAREVPESIPDGPIDIQAPSMIYSNDTVIASGGVTGRFENVMLRADTLQANPESGDLHLEGNIVFERDNVLWQGTALDYNFLNHEGLFGPSALYFEPAHMQVDHIERVSTNEYLLKGATFTSCPLSEPHISAHAEEARLIDEKYIRAKGVVFYAGKVPIFYVPYWRHELSESIFRFELGIGSEWGAHLLTRATIPLNERFDYITDINLYSKRGVGLGQGAAWNSDDMEGEISAFYLKDEDPNTRFDDPSLSDDRYRFHLRHIQRFTPTDYLNTRWSYLSDPAVLDEFFKSEYRRSAQPENYASWVMGGQYIGSEAFANKRVNDFYDNTDRAEYSMDLYRTRIPGTPLYLQSENAVSYLERVYSETNTVDAPYDAVRLDSDNTIYLPQRIGFLNVVPRAGVRATYYSKTEGPGGSDEDELRQIAGAGVEVSFQATKVLSERERWYGKGLRHKIEPYADYIYEESTITTNRLRQFDDVDRLGDDHRVKVGLRNVLQTRRRGDLSRFIDLDLYTYYQNQMDEAPENFDLLYLDARMPLTRRTMVDMEGRYDWYAGKVQDFNTRISHNVDEWVLSLEHYFERNIRSLWTPRIELFPNADSSVEFYGRYDDNSNDLQEAAVVVYKNFCCMRYGLGYHYYDEGEQRVMFSIGLSAYPDARISSGL